jgi:hypothetical protein
MHTKLKKSPKDGIAVLQQLSSVQRLKRSPPKRNRWRSKNSPKREGLIGLKKKKRLSNAEVGDRWQSLPSVLHVSEGKIVREEEVSGEEEEPVRKKAVRKAVGVKKGKATAGSSRGKKQAPVIEEEEEDPEQGVFSDSD